MFAAKMECSDRGVVQIIHQPVLVVLLHKVTHARLIALVRQNSSIKIPYVKTSSQSYQRKQYWELTKQELFHTTLVQKFLFHMLLDNLPSTITRWQRKCSLVSQLHALYRNVLSTIGLDHLAQTLCTQMDMHSSSIKRNLRKQNSSFLWNRIMTTAWDVSTQQEMKLWRILSMFHLKIVLLREQRSVHNKSTGPLQSLSIHQMHLNLWRLWRDLWFQHSFTRLDQIWCAVS